MGEAPDVIVPISTPSAQTVVAATKDIPVVFTAVTDPGGGQAGGEPGEAGRERHRHVDLSPIGKHLDLVKEIMPAARTLGMMYNPGEANSIVLVELLRKEAPARGLAVKEAAAPDRRTCCRRRRASSGPLDAIYVPTDNTVVTALEAIVEGGHGEPAAGVRGRYGSVPRGAIAALGFNYRDVGRQTGPSWRACSRARSPATSR